MSLPTVKASIRQQINLLGTLIRIWLRTLSKKNASNFSTKGESAKLKIGEERKQEEEPYRRH